MANTDNGGRGATPQPSAGQQNLSVLAQYVKDLSFENPGAPQSLRGRATAPNINISINVRGGEVKNNEAEIELRLEVRAMDGETALFVIELAYAGLFRLTNIPAETVHPILFIECPRLLFPFARQIIAEATRNGGFPPLMLDPIDFAQMFQQKLAEDQAASKVKVS